MDHTLRQWRIGDVTVTRVPEMLITNRDQGLTGLIPDATPAALAPMDWLRPHFIADDGTLLLSVHALLVQTGTLNILVDTCIGNDKPRAVLPAWDHMRTAFLQTLASTGVDREAIDVVLCTHLHVDHVGWNTMLEDGRWVPTFPNARHLFARPEFEFWQGLAATLRARADRDLGDDFNLAVWEDSIEPLLAAGLVDVVDVDHVVCDEVRLVSTPGHTAGHVSVAITSAGQRAFITGDMYHHPCQITRPDWYSSVDHDRAQAIGTRRDVRADCARSGMLVIGTHFAEPTAGHVRQDGDAFRFIAHGS